MSHRFVLSILAVVFFGVLPVVAHADVIYSQTSMTVNPMDFNGVPYETIDMASDEAGGTASDHTCFKGTGQTLGNVSFYFGSNVPASTHWFVQVAVTSTTNCGGTPLKTYTTSESGYASKTSSINTVDLSQFDAVIPTDEYFSITAYVNPTCDVGYCTYLTAGDGTYPYFVLNDTNTSDLTRISTVTPAASSTVATSSAATFGVTGYVNSADYTSGMFVQVKYAPFVSSQLAVAAPTLTYTTLDFPLSSAGQFSFSTTSPLTTAGKYFMQTNIEGNLQVNLFGLFNFGVPFLNSSVVSTTTNFIAAQLNAYDILQASTTEAIQSYLASSTVSLSSCASWTQFNLVDCLNLLFVPQPQMILQAMQSFVTGFLSYAPWGYATRFVTILSSQSTTTLPSFNYTIYPDGNDADGLNGSIDMNEMITGGGTALNSIPVRGAGGLDAQQIFEPWIDIILAILVIITIVRDLTGHGRRH